MAKEIEDVELAMFTNLGATYNLKYSQLSGVESQSKPELDLPLGARHWHPITKLSRDTSFEIFVDFFKFLKTIYTYVQIIKQDVKLEILM